MGLSLKICRDVWGGWSVHGLAPLPVAHLPSLSASVDYARNEWAAARGHDRVVDRRILCGHPSGAWVAASDRWPRNRRPAPGCYGTLGLVTRLTRDLGDEYLVRWCSSTRHGTGRV